MIFDRNKKAAQARPSILCPAEFRKLGALSEIRS
jgi:hypothetical protein